MILALTLGLALLQQSQDQDMQQIFLSADKHDIQGRLDDGTGLYWIHVHPTDAPRISPHPFGKPAKPGEFYYHTDAYANEGNGRAGLRFRVFSENPTRNQTMGKAVALELLVLWRLDHDRLGIDHKKDVNNKVVDVYLCEHGDPGGEQLFESEPSSDGYRSVNSIYIYDVSHFDDKMEQAREVAHEYGHAVLTPVGGFDSPEYWANGYMGEKLFLRWGWEAILKKQLQEQDFMSAPSVRIGYWVEQNVDPLVKAAATRRPDSPLLSGKNKAAFDAFEGEVMWCDTIMPPKMFARTLAVIGSIHAKDYVPGAVVAAEEATYSPNIPANITDPVWIPVGTGKVTGGTVIEKKLGWCLVKHGKAAVTVHATLEPS